MRFVDGINNPIGIHVRVDQVGCVVLAALLIMRASYFGQGHPNFHRISAI
jgi:hypothetical protein